MNNIIIERVDKMENSINMHRELFCVLFPAIVKNDEKAIQCLGGLKNLSQVYCQAGKKRLGLSFQPDNPFVKKINSDYKSAKGVLLKLKVKKVKNGNEIKKDVVSTSVVGSVKRIHKFESMCDLQYMPVSTLDSNKMQCVAEKILPSGTDDVDSLSDTTPLYIVPTNFTRNDKPIAYCYTDKRYGSKDMKFEMDSKPHEDDIHKTRVERGVPIPKYTFNLFNDMPSEPHEYYIKQKKTRESIYPQLAEEYEIVKKLFEERPVLSMNLIKYQSKIKLASLKIILPCLALYMKDGPWRMMWVKYGYDPRKNPGARIYQTLDFRVRHAAGLHSMIMTRDQVLNCKKTDRIRNLNKNISQDDITVEDIVYESAIYFRPGMVPCQRQIYYQYCDIQIPEVQALLAQEPAAGTRCHARRGWLPTGLDHICRDHMFANMKQTLLATSHAGIKLDQLEQDTSGDESSSDEDNASTSASVTEIDES